MTYQALLSSLSPHIFWDVDKSKMTEETDARKEFLIVRVMEYGNYDDFKKVLLKYGWEQIKNSAVKARYLDDVTHHFIALATNTPIGSFRCYNTKQLTKGLWPF
jgi:hypothetical protein